MSAPVWLAADASPVLARPLSLAQVARPARGRAPLHHVLFSIVPRPEAGRAAGELAGLVALSAGPTRCSLVAVQVAFDDEDVARLLRSPITRRVPARRLNATLAVFNNVAATSVLLVGYCRVLWPQVGSRVVRS